MISGFWWGGMLLDVEFWLARCACGALLMALVVRLLFSFWVGSGGGFFIYFVGGGRIRAVPSLDCGALFKDRIRAIAPSPDSAAAAPRPEPGVPAPPAQGEPGGPPSPL